jgi:predicted HTH domain antitoxin
LRLYHKGKVSQSRAAEIAGISLWAMIDLINQAALPAAYTLQEAVEEVRQLVAQILAFPKPT